MMEITVTGGEEATARFSNMIGNIRTNIRGAITTLTAGLQASVMNDKLSGQVLNVRSGRLRSSINGVVSETASAVTGSVGTGVVYAAFWEYGFSGTENVREHQRLMTMVFGRAIDPREVTVRAHPRKVDQASRSYLRSALADYLPTIQQTLTDAVAQAVDQ